MSGLFPERVETERLMLERLCHENVETTEFYDAFAAGRTDEAVFEHVPQEPYQMPKEAHDRIEDAEERWQEGSAATYAVRPGEDDPRTGEIAGIAHLHCEWEKRTGRLGLILRRPFWGRGYSGERAAALVAVAFDRLDLELVEAGCNAGNENSRRAIEKYVERFGGDYEGRLRNWVPMGDRIDDYHRYTVTREQWERNRGDEP